MQMYPYQVKGVEHLLSNPFGRPHALLADAPGTGKTIMDIEANKAANCTTGIILCPAIIKEQWRRQMVKWGLCAEDEVQVLYGLDAQLDKSPWKILNYALVREPAIRKQLMERKWHSLNIDEGHNLKGHDSQQTAAVLHRTQGIANNCYYKWVFSGSIVPNRPVELYPILKTLAPEVIAPYDSWSAYISRYCGGAALAGRGASNIKELTARLQPFMLRRELQDVWAECPPVIDNVVWLDVPYQLHPEWQGSGFMMEATERRVVAEAKIPYIVAYLKERLDSGVDKIVCFAYHRRVIDQIELELKHFNPVKIYGGMGQAKREANLARFTNDASCGVMLLQIASGGEGLDGLQHVAREYVRAEPEWSPGREDQAGRRILRLGQKRTVISTQLLASNSYEETIYYSNQRKRKVIDVVLKPNGGNFCMSLEANVERVAIALEAFVPVAKLITDALNAGQALQQMQIAQQPQQTFAPPVEAQIAAAAAPVAAPPLPVAPPAIATAPAPLAAAAAPAITPAALPVAAAVQAAPVATALPVGATAPVASVGMTNEEFQAKVVETLKPLGQAGWQKCKTTMESWAAQGIGSGGLTTIPAEHYQNFLAAMAA